jgi:hypothetical protein
MRNRLARAVESGKLEEQRLNEAAARMLALHDDATPCTGG